MSRPFRVLFVCVGNSCRSQMAEAYARHRHPDIIEPASAGLSPAAEVQPLTRECMAEHGVRVNDQFAKSLDQVDWRRMDLLVNISGHSVLSRLPDFQGLNLVWDVTDPIGRPIETYRKVRDRIEKLVDGLAETLHKQKPLAGE